MCAKLISLAFLNLGITLQPPQLFSVTDQDIINDNFSLKTYLHVAYYMGSLSKPDYDRTTSILCFNFAFVLRACGEKMSFLKQRVKLWWCIFLSYDPLKIFKLYNSVWEKLNIIKRVQF